MMVAETVDVGTERRQLSIAGRFRRFHSVQRHDLGQRIVSCTDIYFFSRLAIQQL